MTSLIKAQTRGPRPWAITALAILLLIQAFLLVNLGSFKIYQTLVHIQVDVDALWQTFQTEPLNSPTMQAALKTLWQDMTAVPMAGMASIPSAFLAVLSAIGLLRLWPIAWINAMFVQGVVLLVLLIYHFSGAISGFVDYLIMAYSVFIVLYLNYDAVHQYFHNVPYLMPEEDEG